MTLQRHKRIEIGGSVPKSFTCTLAFYWMFDLVSVHCMGERWNKEWKNSGITQRICFLILFSGCICVIEGKFRVDFIYLLFFSFYRREISMSFRHYSEFFKGEIIRPEVMECDTEKIQRENKSLFLFE